MMLKSVVLLGILVVVKSETNFKFKNHNITVNISNENEALSSPEMKDVRKTDFNKSKVGNDKQVYLEDVFYGLRNQNWDEDEELCLNHTMLMLRSLQNYTLWAVWMWDSTSSEPHGIFYGSKHHLGNFDQCLFPPWPSNELGYVTQYCLADVNLAQKNNYSTSNKFTSPIDPHQSALEYLQYLPRYYRPINKLTWGVCVPASCSPSSVQKLLKVLLHRSHLGVTGMDVAIQVDKQCQQADRHQIDAVSIAFVCVVAIFIITAALCTYIATRAKYTDTNTTKMAIVKTFCIKDNAENLLRMKSDGLEVLYGLRFLSICVIAVGHQFAILHSGPVSNGRSIDKDYVTYPGIFLVHQDLCVDTFFWMSGLLTIWTLLSLKRFPNPFLLLLKRYVRLAAGFAMLIFFLSGPFANIGSGPLWTRAAAYEMDACLKNWWLGLLMLNNYIDSDNICFVISWYIPCDFHFFIVSLLVWCVWRRNSSLGLVCGAVLGIASILGHGVINYIYELPALQLFTYEFNSNPRSSQQFHLTYIKSHTRFGPYFVGMVTGYVFSKWMQKGKQISKMWSAVIAWSGVALMGLTTALGWVLIAQQRSPLEEAIYAALNRPAWACGLSALLLCCAFGCVPFVAPMLRWRPWVPLSRLVYGVYLVHGVIVLRNVGTARNPAHHDYFYLLVLGAGDVVCSCGVALALWLFVEAPINNLLALCLASGKKHTVTECENQDDECDEQTDNLNRRNFESNLIDNAHFSSKV